MKKEDGSEVYKFLYFFLKKRRVHSLFYVAREAYKTVEMLQVCFIFILGPSFACSCDGDD
jgi:hypothetical protein